MKGAYDSIEFPDSPEDRPYTFINMVATIDGKIVSGNREEPVHDIGSELDHQTMRQIESAANAVAMGASSLRATPTVGYAEHLFRFVFTLSGGVPTDHNFFTDHPEKAFVVTSELGRYRTPEGVQTMVVGDQEIDPSFFLRHIKQTLGIERFLLEGGGETNARFLEQDLIDEIFLTIAPKIKMGEGIPTMAEGRPFERERMSKWSLVSCIPVDDEVYLRYRRKR